MAAQWLLLAVASFASLAFCAEPNILTLMTCCRTQEVMMLDVRNFKDCLKPVQALYGKPGPMPTANDVCGATDCIFKARGLLGGDKKVKKVELRKLFVDTAAQEGKSVVGAALDKCFGKLDEMKKQDPCKSGMEPLMGCFNKEVFIHCPDKMWNSKDPQCKGAKEKVEKFPI